MNLGYFKKDSKIQVWVCIDSLEDAGGTFWQVVLTIIGLKKNNFNACCFLKFKPRDNNNYLKILLENNIYLSYPKNFFNDYYKLIKIIKPFATIASIILFPLYYFRNRAYKGKKNVDFFKENSSKILFQYIFNKINYHLDPNDHRKKILTYFQNRNLFNFLNFELNISKPDLLHVFHQKGPENFINWAKNNNIKVIYSESSSADKGLPYYNNNFLSAVKNVDAIFAMSEKHAEKIKSNFDYNGKIFSNTPSMIIYNGHYIKEKFMLAKKEKIVIGMAASRVCTFKGFDLTIKAAAVLSNEYNLILKLVGEEINQDFRILANSLNLKNVHFLGFLTPMDMSNFYKQIDILIIASKWEGLPTVMLEAMSFGIPVISTKVGEIPNFIKDGHNGLFFENDNYKDLAEKIDSLIQNEDLYANLSINSIDFSRNFYYENVVEKMIKNYKEILS
jgi:glycosyltransferase involved in cell wall biosynthesis